MGAIASRQNAGVEEADVVSNHAYKYPPRSGNYFGNHFIMGGERFDTPQPEAYLFGENADLNFLGSRPTPFPYPPPQSNEPTKTLRSLVNIRKESLRFVRCPEPVGKVVEESKLGDPSAKPSDGKTYYNIEFTFDCDVRCAITIHYFCTEELTPNGVVYYPRDPSMSSQTYHYKKGANQQFCQLSHVLDPSRYPEEDLLYNMEKEIIPIAIYCQVDEGQEGEMRQSHTTIAVAERHTDGTYVLKALKQKLFVDGLCYLLQEIYGIENKNLDTKINSEEEAEESGSECVICMCDVRDTLILPCRHLCLCNSCADSLRYQANNCPICRAPFRALLQIRALQRVRNALGPAPATSPPNGSMEHIPPGYEAVSLVEALNGSAPPTATPAPPTAAPAPSTPRSPSTEIAAQAVEALNRGALERTSSHNASSKRKEDKPHKIKASSAATPEFRMSVLLAREEDSTKPHASSPLLQDHRLHNGSDTTVKSAPAQYLPETSSVEGGDGDVVTEPEPDSDAERKSPLLAGHIDAPISKCNGGSKAPAAQAHGDVSVRADDPPLAHIDDTDCDDTDHRQSDNQSRSEASSPPIEDDYYTPEDAHNILSTTGPNALSDPLTSEGVPQQRWALPHHITSLPGTPLSASSVRSSGESYSSTSSSRQLLAPAPPAAAAPPATITVVADTVC